MAPNPETDASLALRTGAPPPPWHPERSDWDFAERLNAFLHGAGANTVVGKSEGPLGARVEVGLAAAGPADDPIAILVRTWDRESRALVTMLTLMIDHDEIERFVTSANFERVGERGTSEFNLFIRRAVPRSQNLAGAASGNSAGANSSAGTKNPVRSRRVVGILIVSLFAVVGAVFGGAVGFYFMGAVGFGFHLLLQPILQQEALARAKQQQRAYVNQRSIGDFDRLPNTKWKATQVRLPWLPHSYAAWVGPMTRGEGYVWPHFSADVSERVVADLLRTGASVRYDPTADSYFVRGPGERADQEARALIRDIGKTYDIGGRWDWEEAVDSTEKVTDQ